jgi:hypothetical protein
VRTVQATTATSVGREHGWYVPLAVSRRRNCTCGTVAAAAVLALAGCGGGARQDANEPSGRFPVDVTSATFPTSQRLAEHTHMVIEVRNDGTKLIPDIAVTIVDPTLKQPTAAQAFGADLANGGPTANLASLSRPVWIIDSPPGPCRYSCRSGGPGGAVTAYANTWALGPLRPGATAKFVWGVTAVKSGKHVVQYQVAAGLNGKARAVLAGGRGRPWGTFTIDVSRKPQQSYVNDAGQVVPTN